MVRIIRDYHRCIKGRTYREATLSLRRWKHMSSFGPFYPSDETENLSTKINSRVRFTGDNFLKRNRYRKEVW